MIYKDDSFSFDSELPAFQLILIEFFPLFCWIFLFSWKQRNSFNSGRSWFYVTQQCYRVLLLLLLFRSDTLNNHIDRKRTQLSQLQRQLSDLETNVHELKSQKVTLLEKYFCLSASSNLFYLFLSSEFP